MASDTTTPIRIAQAIGITSSLFAAGLNLGFSTYVIPSILESPAPLLLKQWSKMFDAGIKSVPPLAVTSGAIWLTLAYNARQAGQLLGQSERSTGRLGEAGKFGRYVAAGILCVAMVPYTFVFLGATNKQLMSMAAEQAKAATGAVVKGLQRQTAHQLVDRWGMLNLPRAVMLLVGGVLGLWTALE